MDEKLLTARELAGRLQVSESKVRALYRGRRIPVLRVSYRCLRFDYPKVLEALATPEK